MLLHLVGGSAGGWWGREYLAALVMALSVSTVRAQPPAGPAPAPPPRVAPASDPATQALEALAREVSSTLRCPVCQGLSIQDSPADLAVEMKGLVKEQLAAGKSPDDVRKYFTDKYGEWVLLEPKAAGFNLTVYVLPLAAVLVGGYVVSRAVRRWTRDQPPTPDDQLPTILD